MRIKSEIKFFLIVLLLLAQACSPLYYVPSNPNLAMMTDKGDVTGNVYTGWGDEVKVMGAIATFSPIKNIGFTASTFSAESKNSSEYTNSGYGSYHDIGALYYRRISRYIFVDGAVGYGFGKLLVYTENKGEYKSRLSRWYIQPGVYTRFNNFECGFAARVLKLNYNQPLLFQGSTVLNAPTTSSYYFLESTIKIAVGFKNIKIFGQATTSEKILVSPELNYSSFTYSVGMSISFNPYTPKKTTENQ